MISIAKGYMNNWRIMLDDHIVCGSLQLNSAAIIVVMAHRYIRRKHVSERTAVICAVTQFGIRGCSGPSYRPFIHRIAEYPEMWLKCERYLAIYEKAKVDRHFEQFHEPFPF